jgi:hypothetical protein
LILSEAAMIIDFDIAEGDQIDLAASMQAQ